MTQVFIGYKPSVGPVVKILKYDTDDPLTLANDAYDRYYFNSENQKLAIVRDQNVQVFNYNNQTPTDGPRVINYGGGGNNATSNYVGVFEKLYSSASYGYIYFYGRRANIFKDITYPPLYRTKVIMSDGWTLDAIRDLQWIFDGTGSDPREYGVYTSSQENAVWIKAEYQSANPDWTKRVPAAASFMGTSDWILAHSARANGRNGNEAAELEFNNGTGNITYITGYWDIPADSTPVTTYTNQPNLEMFRASSSGVIMSRPGYSIDSSAGTRHRIIDSTINLASVVMTGTRNGIAAGQTVTIPSNLPMPMASTSIVEMMIKESGEAQYIPPHILQGYAKDRRLNVSHKVNQFDIQIRNNGTSSVDIVYIVFNIDTEPQTTGGNQIFRSVPIGGKQEIQIKKPGSSDTNPKTSDILLDTRFPTLQIIKEGFIPASDFTDNVENYALLGRAAKNITFNNNGFIPFVKHSLVFSDRIHPPTMAIPYGFSVPAPNSPSKFSSLARLSNSSVKFWINPDSWARMYWSNEAPQVQYYGPNPLGIRYYIFGIA